jgi:hypothetical protein
MGSPLLHVGRQADMAKLTEALLQTIRCECSQQDMATYLTCQVSSQYWNAFFVYSSANTE